MKLHLKITVLLVAFSAILILSFLSFHYVNRSVLDVFSKENHRNQEKIIDNVIAIKTGTLKQIVEDNSAWDDMISFAKDPDSIWAIDNVDFIVNVFHHSIVMVYNSISQPVHIYSDSMLSNILTPPDSSKIDSLFSKSPYCHYFEYSGNELIEYYGAGIVPSSDATARKTKPHGYLLSGQEWNEAYMGNLSESTGFQTVLYKAEDSLKIERTEKYDIVVKDLTDSEGNTVAKVVFRKLSSIENDLKTFLDATIVISIIAGISILVFLFYFRRLIMDPISLISRTLDSHEARHLNKLHTSTPEFIELKELVQKFFKQQEELKSNYQRLHELNSTKDKLFSIIGHDLRNPVGNIMAAAGIMTESIKRNELENAEILSSLVEKESGEALNLLETLLDWAKTQTGTLQYNPKRVQVKEIIDRVANNLNTSAQLKDIKIDTTGPVDFEVLADYNMLTTILRNLLSNAIKFTNPGGWVRITVSKNGNEIDFMIEDNGIGMDDTTVNRLFKAETNYSTYGTANEKGTGLGLIICKEFIEKHGGSIRVQSEKGKGTRFIFNIFEQNEA